MCLNVTKVIYNDVEFDVKSIGFLDELKMDDKEFTDSTKGKLSYLISDGEASTWVLASDCLEVPEGYSEDFFEQDNRSDHLLDLGYGMVKWLEGLQPRPDNSKLPAIVSALMAIQYEKEGGYGSSWKGKGEYRGIMSNIDRKYDRLDKMSQDELEGAIESLGLIEDHLVKGRWTVEQVKESKIDAIADLTNYGLLYMTYVRENFPNVFNIWVQRNIPQYLRDNLPLLENHTEQIQEKNS